MPNNTISEVVVTITDPETGNETCFEFDMNDHWTLSLEQTVGIMVMKAVKTLGKKRINKPSNQPVKFDW